MGSTRCRHFVQNAWKKDLCSNCFKSRDEHAAAAPARSHHRQAVMPAPAGPPPQSILKGGAWSSPSGKTRSKSNKSSKARRVYFPAEESEVIGEGGEDAGPPSDDEGDGQVSDDWGKAPVEDDPKEREEERLLQALTRSNTDFNSIAANLDGTAAPKQAVKQAPARVTAPLQLGRPQTDAEGKKQTLLVSVQPFGKPSSAPAAASTAASTASTPSTISSSSADHVTKIPVATPPSSTPTTNGDVVLKSIVYTSGEQASTAPPPSSNVSNAKVPSASESLPLATNPAPTPTPSPAPTLLKLNDAQSTPGTKAATPAATAASSPAPLSSKHIFLKSIVEQSSMPNGHSVSSPSVTAVSTSVPSIMSTPNTTSSSTPKASGSPAKSTVTATTTTATPTSSPAVGSSARREGKRTHITRGTPISKNNELLLKTKFIPLRTSTILNNNNNNSNSVNNKRNSLSQKEAEEGSMVKINGAKSEPVMLIEAKQLDSSDEDERAYSNVQVQSKCKRLDEDTPSSQTKRLASLLAPLGDVGVVGSRELAGEPDGRADPDSSSESGSEPPALPQSPPPSVDPRPRPSFLHGLTARLTPNGPAAQSCVLDKVLEKGLDKPRVPAKSSTVVQAASLASAAQQQYQLSKAAAAAASEPPQAPSCSPPSSAETSPMSTPIGSPHGTPPQSESCSRQQKRQAPLPPQESAVYATTPTSTPTPPMRPALGRSASTGSSSSCSTPSASSPAVSPAASPATSPAAPASPPSPVMYHRQASSPASTTSTQSPVSRQKDASVNKRRSSQHLLMLAPLPPMAPARSESVPSGLGHLGHSVTLGAHSGQSIAQALAQANSFVSMAPSPGPASGQPQPSPRRVLSMSTDSLSGTSPTKHVMSYDTERKKPGTKVRFSLRKFLGLSKDGGALRSEWSVPDGSGSPFSPFSPNSSKASSGVDPLVPPQPRPRPRLEIIHPSDLSGRAVEVLRVSGVEVRRQMQEQAAQQAAQQANQAQTSHAQANQAFGEVSSTSSPTGSHSGPQSAAEAGGDVVKTRPNKPPPPPRSQSLENELMAHCSPSSRPSRPPPPKSSHADMLLRRHSSTATTPTTATPTATTPGHSVYANVACVGGEVRVAPLKPQRTGSVRDATAEGPRMTAAPHDSSSSGGGCTKQNETATRTCSLSSQPEDSGYESVELSDSTQPQSMTDSDNVYECVNGTTERSSSPECDSKRAAGGAGGGNGGGTTERPASMSAQQYCGSETESDIYSPYSFYGSEEGDDAETDSSTWRRSRVRKGRSVVHKSMEDNYGAVVGTNLEALAQLLEQVRTGPAVPTNLRPLKTASGLSWCDFAVELPQPDAVAAGRWVFLAGQWSALPVTLAVSPVEGKGSGRSRGTLPFALMPIVEFSDRVPSACVATLPGGVRPAGSHVQAVVGVLARARVDTMTSFGTWLRGAALRDAEKEATWREAGLVLLQLVNAMVAVQGLRLGEAVETDNVVLLRGEGKGEHQDGCDGTPQLALLHGAPATSATPTSDAAVCRSLCQCVLAGVRALLPAAPPTPLLTSLLSESEPGALALSRTKAVLEYWLWGPVGPAEAVSSSAALQRWLDLERATVLHRLVCARAASGPSHRLAIQEQSHLLFLVHTSAATMCDASRLLESACVSPLETSA